jgi:hypothetical protein
MNYMTRCGVCYDDFTTFDNDFVINGLCGKCRQLLIRLGGGQKDTLPEIVARRNRVNRRLREETDKSDAKSGGTPSTNTGESRVTYIPDYLRDWRELKFGE